MKKKQPVYKGLDKTSVLYNDQSEYSPEIFDIKDYPKRLTAGKNIFRFRGNLENLAQNSPLDIEIIDYNGEPIYHEITTYIAEDKSRVVSIYIYPDTSPGPATITLLTEIQRINGTAVPENWKNVYNAKWSRTVYVNPTLDNESEIIFETLPTVEIEEQIGVQLDRTYSVSQFPIYNSGSVKYVSRNGSPILIISGGAFSSSMQGGTVTVNSPNNPFPNPTYTFTAVPYSTKVKKVLNTSSILLDTEYNIASTHSIVPHTYTDFNYSSYNLEYEQVPSYVVTENSESYAIIKINNLQPLTGDISRIKTFINNNGTVGTWEQISDIELEETEIFVSNTASLTPDKSIGFIDSQNTIDTYFSAHMYDENTYIGAPEITYNTSILNNSLYIQSTGSISNGDYNAYWAGLYESDPWNEPIWWPITGLPWPPPQQYITEYLNSTNTSIVILKTKDAYKGTFIQNSKYKVTLDALSITPDAKISVYLSGSAINTDFTDRFNNDLPIIVGKKIGELDVTKLGSRIDDYIITFTADNNGTAVLLFVIERGDWYLSDIRTTSDNDPGYTPNYTRIRTLVPTSHKSDVQLNFKVEYYNAGGVKCKQINYINKVPWAGGNRYIDGEYSMLTGSLYVADSLESGIAISGYKNSGFVRSLGYSGFAAAQPGFLLWSGSAMSGSLGTKGGVPYSGVGLEMYANSNNYFRYSTANSELDIKTNSFFLGSTSSSFISGSNGKLQISASNFSVDAIGNVTASNMHLDNVAYADAFVNTTATITDSNRHLYFENYTIQGLVITGSTYYTRSFSKLVLDGSLGGISAAQARLETQPDWPIGMIIPPGHTPSSTQGYTISIENYTLATNGGFGGIFFANAVASSSYNLSQRPSGENLASYYEYADMYDFGFNADVWDYNTTSYGSFLLGYLSLRGLSVSETIFYGENALGIRNCWNGTTVSRGNIFTLSFGNMVVLRRNTNGNNTGGGAYLPDSYWDIIASDDVKSAQKYFGQLKIGNSGVLIGGEGRAGQRGAPIHLTQPHGSAILQLDAGRGDQYDNGSFLLGSGSVFIPPRLTTGERDYSGDPVAGSIIYNSTTNKLQVRTNVAWVDLH